MSNADFRHGDRVILTDISDGREHRGVIVNPTGEELGRVVTIQQAGGGLFRTEGRCRADGHA